MVISKELKAALYTLLLVILVSFVASDRRFEEFFFDTAFVCLAIYTLYRLVYSLFEGD